MNKRLKARWVAALRSGKFVQGRECLRKVNPDTETNTYCCLGVLAEITTSSYKGSDGFLSTALAEKIGITPITEKERQDPPEDISETRRSTIQIKLAARNDNGWSFKRIATYIERYL